MSKQPIVRTNPQTAEDKQLKHYFADWWIYALLAFFIGGLIFMTFALELRGEAMSEFGKPGSKTAVPDSATSAAPAPAPATAEKK